MNLEYENGPEDIEKFPLSGIHPDTGVKHDSYKAEPRDILSKDADGNSIRVCTTEMGLGKKGNLEDLFNNGGVPDFKNDGEAKAYVKRMMEKLKNKK